LICEFELLVLPLLLPLLLLPAVCRQGDAGCVWC
jgi:hypothetical protein